MPDGNIYVVDSAGKAQRLDPNYSDIESSARLHVIDNFGAIFGTDAPLVDITPDNIGECLVDIITTESKVLTAPYFDHDYRGTDYYTYYVCPSLVLSWPSGVNFSGYPAHAIPLYFSNIIHFNVEVIVKSIRLNNTLFCNYPSSHAGAVPLTEYPTAVKLFGSNNPSAQWEPSSDSDPLWTLIQTISNPVFPNIGQTFNHPEYDMRFTPYTTDYIAITNSVGYKKYATRETWYRTSSGHNGNYHGPNPLYWSLKGYIS